jgi:hypothetical protein
MTVVPLLQQPARGCEGWAVRLGADGTVCVSLIGWHPRFVPEYVATVSETYDRVVVDVQQSREQPPGEFWTTSGHFRRALTVLPSPVAGREVVDPDGRRLAVVEAGALLEPPDPWQLVHEEYHADPAPGWTSTYSDGAAQVTSRQGSPALAEVDWDRPWFTPLLLDRPDVRGHTAVLLTFAGEEGQNLLLAWKEAGRGVAVQTLSGVEAEQLVRVANAMS